MSSKVAERVVANRILRFQELLDESESAAAAKAFRGAAHPDSWDEIDREYDKVRTKITKWVNEKLSEILDL